MTGTKVKSAAALFMQTAALGAKSITDFGTDSDFSKVMEQFDKISQNTLKDLPTPSGDTYNTGAGAESALKGVGAPVKVNKTAAAAKPEDAVSASSPSEVISKAAAKDAQQDVNKAIENVREEAVEIADKADLDSPKTPMDLPEEDWSSALEYLSAAVNAVKEALADILGITPEELEEAMEALGMSDADLLNPVYIKPLAIQLTGEGDALSIVTDEKLFDAVKELTDLVDGTDRTLMEELGVDQREFESILQAYEEFSEPAPTINTVLPADEKTATELNLVETDEVNIQTTGVESKAGESLNSDTQSTVKAEISEQGTAVDITAKIEETAGEPAKIEAVVNNQQVTENADIQLSVRDEQSVGMTVSGTEAQEIEDPDHIMEDPLQDVSLTDSRTQHSDTVGAAVGKETAPAEAQEEIEIDEPLQSITDEAVKDTTLSPNMRKDSSESGEKRDSGSSGDGRNKAPVTEETQTPRTIRDDGASQAVRGSDIGAAAKSFADAIAPQSQDSLLSAAPQSTVDAYDILRQINQNMNANLAREVSEVHIQLNPETLGNLHVYISAKEGAITAQFIAENEAVKNALQSQALDLRENLESQGLKVEAVEVTIAGQELNRSYHQNGEGQGRFEEPKKSRNRKIQLEGDTTAADIAGMDIEEEDRLTAEMMAINGNTINYLA